MSDASADQFDLRAECWGHAEDVRAVCPLGSGFLTASRDKTAKLWVEQDAHAFDNPTTLNGHSDYVTAVACIPPHMSASTPDGAFVTGSRDKTVIIWDIASAKPIRKLQGHKWQVTAVAVMPDGNVASASLDGTIRIWDAEGNAQVLEGHEGPVQCLLLLPDGSLASGSNDKTVKLWQGGRCVKTLTGHTDTVRGLSLVPDLGFVSASHDGTLQLWTATGEPVATLAGHTALVYSAAATAGGLIASASEDNTARLWRADGTCLQVLEHPACVWDVAFLPNSDLVTGCADFAARVWTSSAERTASAETIQNFMATLESRKAAAKAGGDAGALPEGLTLEDPMVLTQPGNRDGQTKIVREGGGGMAYSWSAARQEWEKVGEVVAGPDAEDTMAVGGKQLHGRTWDFVFDVDIADGEPTKKLAVDRGEDPYHAADRFLEQENLPTTYREQIANFIVTNSHGAVTMSDVPMNVDPFTGGGAYVPGGAPSSRGPGGGSGSHQVTGGGADPFTGGSSAAAPAAAPSHTPATVFVTFASAPNTEAIARKVRESSGQVGAAELALSDEEATPGGVLDQLLSRAAAGGASGAATAPLEQLALLGKMLRWPAAQLFPALDIARLLALDAAYAPALAQDAGSAAAPGGGGIGGAFATAAAEPQLPANQQTALRLACNAFQHPVLRQWVAAQASGLLDGFASCLQSGSKAVRLGAATFLLNCAVLQDAELKVQLLSGLSELLGSSSDAEQPETLYRVLVALGTVLHQDSMTRSIAADLDVPQQVRQRQAGATGKVVDAAREVLRMFQQ